MADQDVRLCRDESRWAGERRNERVEQQCGRGDVRRDCWNLEACVLNLCKYLVLEYNDAMPRKDKIATAAYMRTYNRAHYLANRDSTIARTTAYNKTHNGRRLERAAARRDARTDQQISQDGARENARIAYQRRYRGLPEPTRPCPEICERPGCGRKANTLDHDHETGRFRSWLCRPCNAALGALGDTPESLRVFADFLNPC
jgi:hypothetical protein